MKTHLYFRNILVILAELVGTVTCFGQDQQPAKPGVKPVDSEAYKVIYTGRLFGYYRVPEVQSLGEKDWGPVAVPGSAQPVPYKCAGPINQEQTPEANEYSNGFSKAKTVGGVGGTALHLAVGDNFAPFLLARQMWNPLKNQMEEKETFLRDPGNGQWVSESDLGNQRGRAPAYQAVLRGDGEIVSDNVGCFLRRLEFDAIVPGEEDFYYGPSRVRYLAKFLQMDAVYSAEEPDRDPAKLSAGAIQPLHVTKMLGVNLYLQTKDAGNSAAPAVPPEDKDQPKLAELPAQNSKITLPAPQITVPKTALPWMRSVQVNNWDTKFKACLVDVESLKSSLKPKNLSQLSSAQQKEVCHSPGEFDMKADRRKDGQWELGIETPGPLAWDTKYAVAVLMPEPVGDRYLAAWSELTVVPPFFGYSGSNAGKMVGVADEPWYVKPPSQPGGKPVAVFGVVDPSIMQFVGKFNDMWVEEKATFPYRTDDTVETDIQVADPAEALSQALEYCAVVTSCKNSRKILLAQMPQATAYNMLASFRGPRLVGRFDAIISEADTERGTGTRTITKSADFEEPEAKTTTKSADSEEPEAKFMDPVVLVPSPGALVSSKNLDQVQVRLQAAIITPGDLSLESRPRIVENHLLKGDLGWVQTEWLYRPELGDHSPWKILAPMTPGNGETLLEHLRKSPKLVEHTALQTQPGDDREQWKTGLRQIALKTLQGYCHSETAMLQLRDVFWVPVFGTYQVDPKGFEAIMDAIFWKGDVMKCANVSGSVINSVLQRSKDLQQTQYYGLLSDAALSFDWSLMTLGADEEQPDPTYRQIEGRLVDPKKLYSVGTTPFLANGDTGYPAFQGAEPPPSIPLSRIRTQLLSDKIVDTVEPPRQPQLGAAKKTAPSSDYLDALARVPLVGSPHTPDTTYPDWWKALFAGPKTTLGKDELQLDAQHKGSWSLNLYKADFGYSLSYHSGLERDIPKWFPGVSAVDLTTADSSTITFDYMARLDRDLGGKNTWGFYIQSEANYGYKKTRQAAKTASDFGDPYTRNQTADFLYNEVGFARHILPSHQSPHVLKFQLPVGLQTQFSPLVALPEGISNSPTTPAAVIHSPKSFYVEARPGLRWDFSFPKPANWSPTPGGGGAGGAGGAGSAGQGAMAGGGGGGKGGKGGGASQSSSSQSSSGGGGGAGQTATFDSFFEFGYEAGPSLHGPKDYVFNDPSHWMTTQNLPAALQCLPNSVNATQTVVGVDNVVNCFNAASTTIPPVTSTTSTTTATTTTTNTTTSGTSTATSTTTTTTTSTVTTPATIVAPTLVNIEPGRTHFQNGLYFNYRLDVPLPVRKDDFHMFSNMEFVSELRSDYFFGPLAGIGKDSPIDTHFLFDAKQSLTIPIFPLFSGKLSLAPTVELIFYANKITNNVYRSYSTSIQLNYSFDKRKGLSWRKALGYPNPVPTLPTLPSR